MKSLRQIMWDVQTRFTWTPDKNTFGTLEHWTSHADEVERGEAFRDDCDGFALTCAELCFRAEYDDVSIAYCLTETGGGHLVCRVDDVVLDNRQRHPIAMHRLTAYEWRSQMSITEPGVWRRIVEVDA